jgi:hypothetical protein
MYEKLFISIFSALHTKHHHDHGDNAKRAKEIAEKIVAHIFKTSPKNNTITSSSVTLLVYHELKKHGLLFADHYKFYSETRLKTIHESFGN